jgi:hypothetical protein
VPSPNNLLPVYGSGHELLQYATIAVAQRLIAAGLVIAEGTKNRIRALIAVPGNVDLLRANGPYKNHHDSHDHETEENPKGVWTFRKLHHHR